MNKIYITVLIAMLAGCSFQFDATSKPKVEPAVPVDIPAIGVTEGSFRSTNDTIIVRSVTVNGTDCIWVGNYKSSSLSCNWK